MTFTLTRFPSFNSDDNLTFTNSEFDMAEYQHKLQSKRDERSLLLRRISMPGMRRSISKGANSNGAKGFGLLGLKESEEDSFQCVCNKESFLATIASHSSSVIMTLGQLPNLEPKYLAKIANDEQIISAILNAVETMEDGSLTNDAIALILVIIASIFQYASDPIKERIAEGTIFPLQNIITSETAIQLYDPALHLVQTFAKYSTYARDTILCYGFLSDIVNIASRNLCVELTEKCLNTVLTSFQRPGDIDESIFIKIIDPLFDMFQIVNNGNKGTIRIILSIFSQMVRLKNTLISAFFEKGLYNFSLNALEDAELAKSCLGLIGDMCISNNLSYIDTLLSEGLFEKLMALIPNVTLTSDVFWVLSNLFEVRTSLIMPKINIEFIQLSMRLADETSFDVKREIAYFFSTIIVFSRNSNIILIKEIVNEDLIELMADMLDSGVNNVMLRCIDGLMTLVQMAVINNKVNELATMFANCEVLKQLEEIVQQENQSNVNLLENAKLLLSNISRISEQ